VQNLFVGVDCSTQSCKLILIDLEKAEVLYTDLVNYDVDLPQYNTQKWCRTKISGKVNQNLIH